MYKCVLSSVIIATVLAVYTPADISAGYLNDTWLNRKSTDYLNGEDYDIRPDEDYLDMLKEFSLEDIKADLLTVGIRPPAKFPKPLSTVTDSIDVKNSRVRQKTEIPNIRTEKYYFIPFDEYIQKNLKDHRDSLWRKNETRMRNWSSERKPTGTSVTDLQFALPVGRRFERFVGGKTRLDINGSQRITFSGTSDWTKGEIQTSTSKNSSFPALTMKQEPRFSIRGDVGERITVDIKQDSQTQSFSNLEENVSIKYMGEENEIVQYIEAGNTSLNLPGATFAGYRGAHKGLFGIRTEGRLGPLKFTAIASQEKSESSIKSYRGSAEESSTQIKDYQYKTNTYFFLDKEYREIFNFNASNNRLFDNIMVEGGNYIETLEVYVDDGSQGNNLNEGTFALRGVARPMNINGDEPEDTLGIEGYFHKLDPQKDYFLDRTLGFIVFTNRLQDSWTVGVYMKVKGKEEPLGELEYDPDIEESKIKLKLIKAKNQRPSNVDTWNLEWKNVYDLRQRNIDIEELEIRVYREATDGVSRDTLNGIPYIQILGLDTQDEFGEKTPDNKIDLNRSFVNPYRGELIIPLLRPFDKKKNEEMESDEYKFVEELQNWFEDRVPEIYETNNQNEKEEASKYYIEVKTATKQAVIRIGGGLGGIMEGTEQVILNGNPLSAGTDYRISYSTGEITLLNEEAMSPTADLVIKYEEKSTFQEMQKTLLGLRGEYDLWNNSRIGTTLLYNKESTRDKRVRLGQEPSRMLLLDTDIQLDFQPEFLTTAIDKIPLIVANETSKILVEGEIAQSLPKMNTKNVVYVDDFEGSKNISLSITRTNWTPASIPEPVTPGDSPLKREELLWYNPWDRIESRKIWPNKETTAGENTVHILNLEYEKPEDANPDSSFAGIMTAFYGAGEDLSRARFIEIWARGDEGELKIDIGSISEDFYIKDYIDENGNKVSGEGVLNTEDKSIAGQGHGDGKLTKEEDTGLDGVFSEDEPGYSDENPDPEGDDWEYTDKHDFTRINGLEGNSRDSDRAGLPDTEDINNNGILDIKNMYYEYTISFKDTSDKYLVPDSVPLKNKNDPNSGKDYSGWRLFRIPLWNNTEVKIGGTGAPDPTLIEFFRMRITGTSNTTIKIASIEIAENNWLELGIFDNQGEEITEECSDRVRIARVNTHENREYELPPGVTEERDPDTHIRRMEQSLMLEFENLDKGNSAYIYRNFQKMNFTDYTALRMYVHGSDEMPDVNAGGRDFELVFRFGGDRENYYELRTPVYRDWEKENFVEIDFETFTSVKFDRDEKLTSISKSREAVDELFNAITDSLLAVDNSLQAVKDSLLIVADSLKIEDEAFNKPGAFTDTLDTKIYTLKGNPSLQNVKVISIGVKNNTGKLLPYGNVWLDELRLDELRNMGGTAARLKINTDLAGFINFQGNMTTKSKDFHDMNAKKGTGRDTFDWNSSVKVNLDRFTPKRWNLSLPVSASKSEMEAMPWLKSGSDITLDNLDSEQKKRFKSTSTDTKYHITYRKGVDKTRRTDSNLRKINDQFLNWATEKISADFDWGELSRKSPDSGEEERHNKQLKITYDVNPKGRKLKPFGWLSKTGKDSEDEEETELKPASRKNKETSILDKLTEVTFAYTPDELNYKYTLDDKSSFKTNLDGVSDETKTKMRVEDYNIGYRPLKSLTYRFRLSMEKDFTIKPKDSEIKPDHPELQLWLPIIPIKWENKDYKLTSYSESNTITYNPPGLFKLFTHKYNLSSQYNENDNPRYSLSSQLGSKTIGYNRTFTATGNITWYNVLEKLKSKPKIPENEGDSSNKKPEKNSQKQPNPLKGKDDSSKNKKPNVPLRNRVIETLTKAFNPISINYNQSKKLDRAGIKNRESNFYKRSYGKIGEAEESTVATRQNTRNKTTSLNVSTDLKLPLNMGLSTKYNYKENINESSSADTRVITNSMDFPDFFRYPNVTFRWAGVEKNIPFIKRYLSNVQLNIGLSNDYQESLQNISTNPDSTDWKTNNLKRSFKYSPSINAVILKKLQTSLSFTKSSDESEEPSGGTKSITKVDKIDIRSTLRYRLTTSRGLLFLKNVKLRSDIDMSLEFGISKNIRSKKIGDGDDTNSGNTGGESGESGKSNNGNSSKNNGFTPISENDSWSITPNISYSFSRKFKGGLKMDFKSSTDRMTNQDHIIREVSIWGELTF